MHISRPNTVKIFFYVAAVGFVMVLASCSSLWKKDDQKDVIARVGDAYLYKKDIASLVTKNMPKEDSAFFVSNYINNWASKQLFLTKAKINLSEDKLAQFDRLVANYRTDLYTEAYKEAMAQQTQDTVISDSQLNKFYENEKENFKLKEKLVKLRFIELPVQFMDKESVVARLKRFNTDDIAYLDSVGVQFKKLNFNDSIWIEASRIIDEIPPLTIENQDRYLKKSQFFELQDSLGVYLASIRDILQVNDIAPLSYIKPTIKQVLLNRRKLEYLKKLETEVLDEAIKRKEFEVYGQKD